MPHEMKTSLATRHRADDAPELDVAPESGLIPTAGWRRNSICAGDLIEDRYRVLNAAATGGMGSVYICEDTLLGRRVAVKYARADADADGNLAARFFGEARITAQLESSHIARLYDYGVAVGGNPYMVVEFVDGPDLFTVLQTDGPRSADEVVSYALQICEGLREAHRKGIVHCDLKPENLVLTRSPEGTPIVKMVDFGISKWNGDARVVTHLRTTLLAGSPNYMSPEQIETPAAVDLGTDIWSLGVVMFELLTGHLPFYGPDDRQTCARVLSGPIPAVSSLLAGVPPELERTILRCLQRDRRDRFADVDQLTLALSEVVLRKFASDDQPTAAADPPPTTDDELAACVYEPSYTPKASRLGRRALVAFAIAGALVLGVRSDESDSGIVAPAHEVVAP